MAFNAYPFILLFLPMVVIAYRLAARWAQACPRLAVLAGAGLVFYSLAAFWALPFLLGSIAFNFSLSRVILGNEGAARRRWLFAGVTGNVALLVIVKYSGFLATGGGGLFGWHSAFAGFALPLGISFFSFQQIAFLVDVSHERVKRPHALTYICSILFFPTIISGPITYFREFQPQIEAKPIRGRAGSDLVIGTVLFAMGLFKKVVLSDTIALWVDPLFRQASAGHELGMILSWAAVLGFLVQMYFDFSGYSDMATGVARMFGVRLPANFFSPMRVTSIIDWWRRWHMSLGRFVNEFIFQPLALPLTRFASGRGLGRWGVMGAGVLTPTFIAMFVIGAWHGGAWTYIVFGLLHAIYMIVAESWRFARRKHRRGKATRWWHGVIGNLLTILCVLIAMAPFRAVDMPTTWRLWRGMVGASSTDDLVISHLPGASASGLYASIAIGLAIAYLMPNSFQILRQYQPVLDWEQWRDKAIAPVRFVWRPTLGWAMVTGVVLYLGFAFIARGSGSFIYFGY